MKFVTFYGIFLVLVYICLTHGTDIRPLSALILLAVINCLGYLYGVWPSFTIRDLPGPEPSPFSGNLWECRAVGQHHYFMEQVMKYGKICRVQLGREPMVLVADLDLIKQVAVTEFRHNYNAKPIHPQSKEHLSLITQSGERWASSRRTLQPSFNTINLSRFAGDMNEAAKDMVKRLDGLKPKESVNIWRWYQSCTMQIISQTSFSKTIKQADPTAEPLIEAAINIFKAAGDDSKVRAYMEMFPWMMKLLMKIPSKRLELLGDAIKLIEKTQRSMLENIKKGNTNTKNFLWLLANAKDDETGEGLSSEEITQQSFLFMLAGYETTANSLAFATYLFAKHPEWQEKVIEEIDRVCPKGKDPTYSDLKSLELLGWCIEETLRLYPPAPSSMRRRCTKDTNLGGYDIPKGTYITVPIWCVHRHPDHYSKPNAFIPTRWDPNSDEYEKRHKFAHIPFGGGPRKCIGYRFALEELKIVLVNIFQNYRFNVAEKSKNLKTTYAAVLRPAGGIFLHAIKRNN